MSMTTIYEAPRPAAKPGETVVTSTCGHNCGGRCVVNAHIVDGKISLWRDYFDINTYSNQMTELTQSS